MYFAPQTSKTWLRACLN